MVMDVIHDAKLILARVERPSEAKKQRLVGLDTYYAMLLERGHLPSDAGIFPNRCATHALHAELIELADLRFTTLRSVGIYFSQRRFRELGVVPWRTAWANGWAFPRLCLLRRDWELRHGGWRWPTELVDWAWSPERRLSG
jgi:hypothetical protein